MMAGTTILSWNIRHGGGGRNMPRIVLALLEHQPDVIVLIEFRRSTGGQIAAALADHGWPNQHNTSPPLGTNGMLIASRRPLTARTPALPAVLCEHAEAAATQRMLEVQCAGLTLVAAHIPCDGAEGSSREHLFQCVLAAARAHRDSDCIVIGDLNAGRHHLDESGATFTCTRLLGQFSALGYVDAWRKLNPDCREFSWYSVEGAGFRLDHAWISPGLLPRLAWCRYGHAERESGVSDHSVLLVGLH